MTISAQILRPALRELEDRVKGFELSIAEGGSAELSTKMLDGELDAAVIAEPDKLPERLNRWPLFEDRYVVLCSARHRLAALSEVPVAALAEECVLVRASRGCDFEQTLDRLCTAAGVKPRTRHTGSSEDHIQEMVAAGLGVAIGAAHQPIAPDLVARPLADGTAVRRIVLTTVGGRQHGPALALFLKLMRARDWTVMSLPGASKS
jgi:DNA-binding transcriptional LysR family regulator